MSSGGDVRHDPSPGPPSAPAAADGAGLLTDAPVLVRRAGGPALRARSLLRPVPGLVSDGLELRYAIFPAFDARAEHIADGFRSSAISVDVVFADGSRLLDADVHDQYGMPASAEATFRRHVLPPDQWSLRRIALPPGRIAVGLEVIVDQPAPTGATDEELRVWIDGADLVSKRTLDRSLPPSEIVDTRRGSHSSPSLSRGLTVPLVSVPHGAFAVHPLTDASSAHWNYSWSAHGGRRPVLQGLALSHTASVWIGDWGMLQLMPRPESASIVPSAPAARGTAFDHSAEQAHPHRYRVELDDGIVVEATATDHVAVLRIEFPHPGGCVVLDRLGAGELNFDPDDGGGILHGWLDGATVHGQVVPRTFLDGRVDGPAVGLRAGDDRAVVLELDPDGRSVLELRLGTSLISREFARRSREREAAAGFVEIRAAAGRRWDERLSLVEVEGATDDQLVSLVSNLARLFAYPSSLGEPDESGREVHADVARVDPPSREPDPAAVVRDGPITANHGFWDTYRTAWPALSLLTPGAARHLLDGVVAQFRDGGWMPRWAAPGPLDAMVGTSADVVLADALALGVLDGELLREGYLAALRDASSVPPHPAVGRKGMPAAMYRGFVADDIPEGLSWALEGALNDAGLYRLATALGAEAERRWFAARALGVSRHFDPTTGFFRGLSPRGLFRDTFDPRVWGGDYTETNAWGMAFSMPYDGAGLAALHGGRDALRRRLDAFFAEPETAHEQRRGSYPHVIHEMTEARDVRMGMWAPNNQPAHHIPYMYLHAGDPAACQRIVREAVDRLFTGSEIGQGYPGDEDNGEMSAWWLFGTLGLYPLAPGSGEWVIGSPRFDRMVCHLPGGDLDVVSHRASSDHRYVQAVRIDGEPWTRTVVPHARLARGARIDVELGASPSDWGRAEADAPSSLSVELAALGWGRLRDALIGTGPLVDDTGDTVVALAPHEQVVAELDGAHPIELLTLEFVDPGPASWRLEGETAAGWVLLDEHIDEPVRWERQTRPFAPRFSHPVQRVRLTALAPLRLAQLEALVAVGDLG